MVAPVVVNSIDSAGLPQAVSPTDPLPVAANMRVFGNGLWYSVASGRWAYDNLGVTATTMLSSSMPFLFNGVSADRLRVPVKFSTTKATTAGSSALWTPASGTSFRLMRYKIDVTESALAAAAGDLDLVFYDGATAMPIAETVYVPATVSGTAWSSGWIDLANGILSAADNNVLNINLSFALTSGTVRVSVAGTEE